MKNHICTLLLLLMITFSGSCSKKEVQIPIDTSTDFVVFGRFYGFCGGESCIEIFKIQNNELFEDSNDTYPKWDDFYVGNFQALSVEKYEMVSYLMVDFPTALLTDTNTVFGMPDASDGGGLYLEYHIGGVHKFWIFDQFQSNVPTQYHAFMNLINQKIDLLQI